MNDLISPPVSLGPRSTRQSWLLAVIPGLVDLLDRATAIPAGEAAIQRGRFIRELAGLVGCSAQAGTPAVARSHASWDQASAMLDQALFNGKSYSRPAPWERTQKILWGAA